MNACQSAGSNTSPVLVPTWVTTPLLTIISISASDRFKYCSPVECTNIALPGTVSDTGLAGAGVWGWGDTTYWVPLDNLNHPAASVRASNPDTGAPSISCKVPGSGGVEVGDAPPISSSLSPPVLLM